MYNREYHNYVMGPEFNLVRGSTSSQPLTPRIWMLEINSYQILLVKKVTDNSFELICSLYAYVTSPTSWFIHPGGGAANILDISWRLCPGAGILPNETNFRDCINTAVHTGSSWEKPSSNINAKTKFYFYSSQATLYLDIIQTFVSLQHRINTPAKDVGPFWINAYIPAYSAYYNILSLEISLGVFL